MLLGLDLASRCGWAVLAQGGHRYGSGVLDLSKVKPWFRRMPRLRVGLDELVEAHAIEAVAYEKIRRHKGTSAAHVYGALEAEVLRWAESWCLPVIEVPVQHGKIALAGMGNASKADMVAAAKARWPLLPPPLTDDEADALGITLAGLAAWRPQAGTEVA